nr:DUF1983 domain-containing protein [Pseudomonas sp. NFACC02]
MNNSGDANSVVDIGYIAVGRRSAAGSAQALSSLTTTVTQQGATISSQATQITGLTTTVGNQSAALQVQANAIADTNGYINSSYSVKLMTTSNGVKVAAGFGLGLGNENGVTQSQFIVSADRFAILNSTLDGNAKVFSPFTVDGGQVFIADAVIKKATIANAIVGSAITSSALTSQGLPVLTLDMSGGQVLARQATRPNTYTQMHHNGINVVIDGVLRVRMGVW